MSLIERGVHKPYPRTFARIAEALDMSVAELSAELEAAEHPLGEAPPSPEQRTFDNHLREEGRRADWENAVKSARQLRERGRTRMSELLSAWRESKDRGEPSDEQLALRATMGELLQDAFDAETALFRTLGDPPDLATVDLDDFAELQAASRFYGELRGMVEGAGLHIRTESTRHAEDTRHAEGAQQEQLESHTVEERPAA